MQINFWGNSSGQSPILSFLEKLPFKPAKKITRWVKRLEEEGMRLLATGDIVKLKGYDNLYELRILAYGSYYRILFTPDRDIAHLLHIFIKKSNQTPQKEINTALKRKRLFNLK